VLSIKFSFQAEDGIRDFHVTGVQTCALPILHVVGIVDPQYLGRSVTAIVGVRTEGRDVEEVVAEVRRWDEVRYAAACAGTYDFILEVVVGSNEEPYDFLTRRLRATPGVGGSDTSLVMKTVKRRHEWKGEGAAPS